METLDNWYRREVYSWRTGAAVGWTLLLQPCVLAMYFIFCTLDIFHPLSWIAGSFSMLFSAHYIFVLVVLTVVSGVLGILMSSSYTVIPDIPLTRLHELVQLLLPSCLLQCLMYLVSGVVTAWVCTSCIGERYSSLIIKSNDNDREVYYLNEYHLFLVVYGMYSGVLYNITMFLHQNNLIQFPVLEQAKFFQVRSRLYTELLKSLSYSFWHTMYFYPFYWMFGHIPKDIVIQHSSVLSSEIALNSVWGLFDVSLLYQTFLCGVFLYFTWTVSSVLYKIYNTEHYAFPVEDVFDDQKNKCLVDALSCNTNSLLQCLGFYDLCHLSRKCGVRRSVVFSLSQPGGHPHNWNKLYSACVAEVNALNQKVQEANWRVFASVPVRQASGEKNLPSTPAERTTATLSYRGTTNVTDGNPSLPVDKPSSNVQTFKDLTLVYLKKKPVFSYFLSELPDSKSRKLFATCQVQVWAVEALSNFATASYTDDKYGVVQRSLPEIVTAIVNLQENVEKHFKLATATSRRNQRDLGHYDTQLGYLLQTTLKSSMYKIVNTFGKHILSLNLSPECVRKLRLFMDYKE
ncbi:nucleoporin NDC1-like isoform X2 [Ylistrum balloti]|uniref:nucleoporin NDC1-like isoform X2 n=1 Tax=Ylistrum balloti TaxID=509963 RepID=UPI002905A093|nr:nucleoporin NDC1-like isoform X2 [Ylistrum balloti]